MLNKKILIGLLVFFIILVIAFVILKIINPGKSNTQSDQQPETAQTVPQLPVYERTGVNPDDTEQIKSILSDFENKKISNDISGAGINEVKISDVSGELVPLKSVLSAKKASIPDALLALNEENDYKIFSCSSRGSDKNFGLIIYARSNNDIPLPESHYQNIIKRMREWEKTMLRDIHQIIFPNETFSEDQLNQNLEFQDGNARYANFETASGEKKSINYKQIGSPIIITSSPECMETAENYFFDVDE